MAPEQAGSSDVPISTRTDGFALGLIAFKLLVGTTYWKLGTIVQIVSQVTLEPMVPASQRGATLGPRFDEWIAKACARDANARFSDPVEQIEALATALGLEVVTVPAKGVFGSGERTPSESSRAIENAPTLAASAHESGERSQPGRRMTRLFLGGVVLAGIGIGVSRALTPIAAIVERSAPAGSASADAVAPAVATPAPEEITPVLGTSTPQAPAGKSDAGVRRPAAVSTPRLAPAPSASVPRTSVPRDPLEDQN